MADNVFASSRAEDVVKSLRYATGDDNPLVTELNDLSREVRFGIVLYGGVSLAVYENGISQELFRATKGAGIYTVIKQLTGSDVVLDIISGTSAGGINGILIGYALANNKDPSNCGDLWREDGDILRLLHHPWDPEPNSILDSEGYYQRRLAQAFAGLSMDYVKGLPDDLPAELEDLDLFVTGTNAYGHVYTEFDSFGHPIDVKNHRALFNLRYRRLINEENDFGYEPADYAKLSRITSSFPVAFAPVQVGSDDPKKPEDSSDKRLRRWGHLTKDKQYFLDGGILNNKPFSSTLRAIFHHTQTREVERLLVYVEPDPESFVTRATPETRGNLEAPNVLTAAAKGLSSIPGYQSISEDLDAIARHNDWVARYKEIESGLTRVSESLMERGKPFDSPATIADIEGAPKEGGSDELMAGRIFTAPESVSNLERVPEQAEIYLRSRFTQVRERVLEGILRIDGHLLYLKDGQRRAAEMLVKTFRSWQEHEDPSKRSALLEALLTFDIYYRMRRLFYITNAISGLLNGDLSDRSNPDREKYRDLWRRLNHRLKLIEIVRAKMEQLLDCADFHWEALNSAKDPAALAVKIWENAQTFLAALLECDSQLNDKKLSSLTAAVRAWSTDQERERIEAENQERMTLHRGLNERVTSWTDFSRQHSTDLNLSVPEDLLLKQTDDDEWEIFKNFAPNGPTDSISQHYCRFIFIDLYLFPMQYMSGFEATDKVATIRFSPLDAKLGFSKDPRKKLCGNELGHFGGFLKSSWRANDLMWGRLDAACQIIQSVLTFNNLERVKNKLDDQAQEYLINSLRQRCKNSRKDAFVALAKDLGSFTSETDPGAKKEAFKRFLEGLVFMAQREILQVEVPNVIEASIAQQGAWNNYDLPREIKNSRKTASKPSRWRSDRRQSDRAVTTYAAITFAEHLPKKVASPEPESTISPPSTDHVSFPPGWGAEYFCNNYDFRDETWQNGVPKSVVIEIFTTMLLVLRKCLITTGGERDAPVAQSMFVKIATIPIWIGYALTRVQRLAPEYFTNVVIALGVLSLSILGMGFYAHFADHTHTYVKLWLIPVLVLLTLLVLFWFMLRKNRASNVPTSTARVTP